jgi:hypothetical protein
MKGHVQFELSSVKCNKTVIKIEIARKKQEQRPELLKK